MVPYDGRPYQTYEPGMLLPDIMDAYYENYMRVLNSERTAINYKSAVKAYMRYNPTGEFTYAGALRMVDGLQADGIQPQSINLYIGCLARVCAWLVAVAPQNIPFANVRNFLSAQIFPRLKVTEKLHQNVTETMDFDSILDGISNVRDRAIFVLAGVAGMRRCEIAALNIDEVKANKEGGYDILIQQAKNGQQRYAHVPSEYAEIIREYRNVRMTQLREKGTRVDKVKNKPPFAVSEKTGKRLAIGSLNWIFKQYAEFSPHKYRHRAAETLYQAGARIEDIAEHIGDTIAVTQKVYKGTDVTRQREVAKLLNRRTVNDDQQQQQQQQQQQVYSCDGVLPAEDYQTSSVCQ